MKSTTLVNKYLPIVLLYFFFNSFLLPIGLLYTTILTPLFILWLYRFNAFNYLWLFFIISAPFVLIHMVNGVDLVVYLKSYLLLFTVFVFGVAFYQFLIQCRSLDSLFRIIVIVNTFLVAFALVSYFIPSLKNIMWYENALTVGIPQIYRLKLFTYEASYYSLLMIPVVLYYYLKILLFRFPNKAFVFLIITIPLLLSLSFGVIMGLLVAIALLLCSDIRLLFFNPKLPRYILATFLLFLLGVFLTLQFYPDNVVFVRIENIFKGRDTSFSGRTFDSIYLGWRLAAENSLLFGSGAGQIKVIGVELFNTFYLNTYTPDQLAIPNSIGDLLAQYGLLGVFIKLGLEVYFFFRTRVFTNYYRLGLFLFIFIYQFTGSYITNIAEYVIWIMAFYPALFPVFNKKNVFATESMGDNATANINKVQE